MTLRQQRVLVDTRLAELRRTAGAHRLSAAGGAARRPRIQQRFGLFLVEAGLHLMTRNDRGRLKAYPSP
jgi:hypothetical protein